MGLTVPLQRHSFVQPAVGISRTPRAAMFNSSGVSAATRSPERLEEAKGHTSSSSKQLEAEKAETVLFFSLLLPKILREKKSMVPVDSTDKFWDG